MKLEIFFVLLVLISGLASANSLSISPDSYSLDVVGGDTKQKEITILWKGEQPVVAKLKSNYDKEGIKVSYSQNPIPLYPDKAEKVNLTISFAVNIKPKTYSITTKAETKVTKPEVNKYYGGDDITENVTRNITQNITRNITEEIIIYKTNFSSIEKLLKDKNKSIEDLKDGIDDLRKDFEFQVNRVDELENQKERLENKIDRLKNETGKTEVVKPDSTYIVPLLILFLVSFVTLLLELKDNYISNFIKKSRSEPESE